MWMPVHTAKIKLISHQQHGSLGGSHFSSMGNLIELPGCKLKASGGQNKRNVRMNVTVIGADWWNPHGPPPWTPYSLSTEPADDAVNMALHLILQHPDPPNNRRQDPLQDLHSTPSSCLCCRTSSLSCTPPTPPASEAWGWGNTPKDSGDSGGCGFQEQRSPASPHHPVLLPRHRCGGLPFCGLHHYPGPPAPSPGRPQPPARWEEAEAFLVSLGPPLTDSFHTPHDANTLVTFT